MPQPTSNLLPILVFLAFTGFTLGLSFWLGRKAKSSAGYFAAHGQVGWFVNGIAFAGDYLSAASFLGICGMIAFYGYDGFLYSIGFLAGWVVALFVIAEPIKKLGKYTFADALNAKYGSGGIKLAAAISTLVVSLFYLIPQMVGAGSLLKALLSLPEHSAFGVDWNHAIGVAVVGGIVILIVVTAGMVSTTWVQFIKGSLLVVFCAILVAMILNRGIPRQREQSYERLEFDNYLYTDVDSANHAKKTSKYWEHRPQQVAVGPIEFLDELEEKTIWRSIPQPANAKPGDNSLKVPASLANTRVYQDNGRWYLVGASRGDQLLLPGGYFTGIRSPHVTDRLNFASLMLALFAGTASLPHILIRYYTVKDAAAARKSTVVGIGAIGFFYILTLYIGLGAMVSGALDPVDSNMAAPLLAKSFNQWMFAIISAIAFTTVLGTVSGLILAAAGAVAHDLAKAMFGRQLDDREQVRVAKLTSVAVGVLAIVLGVAFRNFNVAILVGWAFAVAASANLPALVMILFWRGTTKQGIIASILVGLVTSLTWLLLSGDAFKNLYKSSYPGVVPFSQPGLVTIPLSFVVLVAVSLMTKPRVGRGFEVRGS